MKEFDGHKPPEKVESHHERKIKHEKIRRNVRMEVGHAGLTVFEYNKKTGVLRKAVFDSASVKVPGIRPPKGEMFMFPSSKNTDHVELKVKPLENCIYFQRLNLKTAVRFLKKVGLTKIFIKK